MTTKITLNIDSKLAKRVYKYARERKISVDKMIEKQVKVLLDTHGENNIAPAVKQLAGILKPVKSKDTKKEYCDYVLKKFSL